MNRQYVRRKKCLNRAVESQVLERRLMFSIYYDYNVMASVGDVTTAGDVISSFKGETSINDNGRADMSSGVVRAFDVRSGALRWTWDPIPLPRDGARSSGAANAWNTTKPSA